MTPDSSSLIEADDEARILAVGFREVGFSFSLSTARTTGVAIGMTFFASWLLSQWRPDLGLIAFIFGPLVTAHALWFWAMFNKASASAAARKLPLWERHRLDNTLRRVDSHIKGAK